ncbi:MAG TPA: hypothetical protein VM186_04150 [Planctomycetota bacterium]|nr:hypothetical protein [Planctomycetota bacterium]
MLTPDQILENLQHIVDDWHPLAIAWHVYFAVLAVTAGFGVRSSGAWRVSFSHCRFSR